MVGRFVQNQATFLHCQGNHVIWNLFISVSPSVSLFVSWPYCLSDSSVSCGWPHFTETQFSFHPQRNIIGRLLLHWYSVVLFIWIVSLPHWRGWIKLFILFYLFFSLILLARWGQKELRRTKVYERTREDWASYNSSLQLSYQAKTGSFCKGCSRCCVNQAVTGFISDRQDFKYISCTAASLSCLITFLIPMLSSISKHYSYGHSLLIYFFPYILCYVFILFFVKSKLSQFMLHVEI